MQEEIKWSSINRWRWRWTCSTQFSAWSEEINVPPLQRDLADLKARIIAAVKNIDAPILTRVWQELEYRIYVCRVTSGAHIEHL